MVIEVVAGEVGEDGAFEGDTVDAELVEAVTGHFHRHVLRAVSAKAVQQRLHRYGVGRGVGGGFEFAPKAVADCADNGGGFAEQIACLRQPLADGGFAVGAGDAPHLKAVCNIAIQRRRQHTGAGFQIFNALIGHAVFRRPCETAVVVPKHKRRTVVDGGGNVVAAVCKLALAGDEDVAGADVAAV